MSSIADVVIGATCFSFIAVPTLTLVWVMVKTLRLDYRAIGRSVSRPRFGVKALFLLTTVVAVDLTLVRALGIDLSSTEAIWASPLVAMFAVAVVGFAWLVVRDFSDTFATAKRGSDQIDQQGDRGKDG